MRKRSQMSHNKCPNGYPKQQKWQQEPSKVCVEGQSSRPLIVILSGVAKLCQASPQYQSNGAIKWHPSVAKMAPNVNQSGHGRHILEITNSYQGWPACAKRHPKTIQMSPIVTNMTSKTIQNINKPVLHRSNITQQISSYL